MLRSMYMGKCTLVPFCNMSQSDSRYCSWLLRLHILLNSVIAQRQYVLKFFVNLTLFSWGNTYLSCPIVVDNKGLEHLCFVLLRFLSGRPLVMVYITVCMNSSAAFGACEDGWLRWLDTVGGRVYTKISPVMAGKFSLLISLKLVPFNMVDVSIA